MSQSLLALCARPNIPETLTPELLGRASAVVDWSAALTSAEQHGVGPLLYRHLRAASALLPPGVQPQLQAVYIRHRRANEVRLRTLAEILDTFDAAGVQSRVLKGPALMFRFPIWTSWCPGQTPSERRSCSVRSVSRRPRMG